MGRTRRRPLRHPGRGRDEGRARQEGAADDQRARARQPLGQGRGQREVRDRGPDHHHLADQGGHAGQARRPALRARLLLADREEGRAGDQPAVGRRGLHQGQGAVRHPGQPEQERHRGRRAQAQVRGARPAEVRRRRPPAAAQRRGEQDRPRGLEEVAGREHRHLVAHAQREGLPHQDRARARPVRPHQRAGLARPGQAGEGAPGQVRRPAQAHRAPGQSGRGQARPRARQAQGRGDDRRLPVGQALERSQAQARDREAAEVRRPARQDQDPRAHGRHGGLRARRERPHGQRRADRRGHDRARAPGDHADPAHRRHGRRGQRPRERAQARLARDALPRDGRRAARRRVPRRGAAGRGAAGQGQLVVQPQHAPLPGDGRDQGGREPDARAAEGLCRHAPGHVVQARDPLGADRGLPLRARAVRGARQGRDHRLRPRPRRPAAGQGQGRAFEREVRRGARRPLREPGGPARAAAGFRSRAGRGEARRHAQGRGGAARRDAAQTCRGGRERCARDARRRRRSASAPTSIPPTSTRASCRAA